MPPRRARARGPTQAVTRAPTRPERANLKFLRFPAQPRGPRLSKEPERARVRPKGTRREQKEYYIKDSGKKTISHMGLTWPGVKWDGYAPGPQYPLQGAKWDWGWNGTLT